MEINNNGFDYVDLDLPSGTLWATMNVGASSPSESGLYFQWGDTKGYTKEQVGKNKQFSWANYKFSINGNGSSLLSKYTSFSAALELEDDAAHVHMGGDWHIPSPKQIRELIDNTTSEWRALDGINGMKFASKKDDSKFIFIPAAGYAWSGSVFGNGSGGNIWSSSLCAYYVSLGQELEFYPLGAYNFDRSRESGLSVRGVIDGKQYNKENVPIKKESEAITNKVDLKILFTNKIKSLKEKIKEIWKKKNDSPTNDYSKLYTGKYVKITTYDMTKKELSYINECIYVRNVCSNMNSDNLALTLQGQGFCYNIDEIEGNFSEAYSKTLYGKWINYGLVKVNIISKKEYKKELNKMIDFISNDFDDAEIMN